jgi:hypothetical protein
MYESKSAKQGDDVLNESLELGRFSCLELARMRMPGFPTTEQGWGKVVAREKWPWIEVQAKGGKNGVKRVYTPPPALLDVIRRHSSGEVVTEAVVAAARAQPASGQVQHQGGLDEQGLYLAQYHDMGKSHPAFQKAAEGAGVRRVIQHAAGAGKTLSSVAATMTMMSAQALSAGFRRAIWLVDAGQAELLVLGNRTIARLEEESARRQLTPEALVGDTEILDAALRLEWLLMQRELQASPADQS